MRRRPSGTNTRLLSLLPDLKTLFMSGSTANVIDHHLRVDEYEPLETDTNQQEVIRTKPFAS